MPRRRPVTVALVGFAVVCAVAAPAAAWVALSAKTDVTAATGEVGSPTGLTTSVTVGDLDGGKVRLRWHAPAGPTPTGWQVERQATDADPAVWAVVSPVSGPDCTAGACTAIDDHGAPGGAFRYRVTALLHAWSGPVSARRLSASLSPVGARVAVDSSGLHAVSVNGTGSRGLAAGDAGLTFGCPGPCTGAAAPEWMPGMHFTRADLRAVSYGGDKNAWAVGAGAVWHCTDDCFDEFPAWSENTAAAALVGPSVATGVLTVDAEDYVALVAGSAFLFSTSNGGAWSDGTAAVGAPPGTMLHAVAGPGGQDLLVTGIGGFAALCRTTTGTCGDPGTFTPVAVPAELVSLTWDEAGGSYLAADADGVLWRGTPGEGITWEQDAAAAGAPGGIRGIAAATVGETQYVWAVAPGATGVGASTIWHHDGAGWAAQPLSQPVASGVLTSSDENTVTVSASSASSAPSLPMACTAPALVAAVDVPAGPAPSITPDVLVRLRLVTDGGATALQVLGSTDGVTWGAPTPLTGGGDTWSAALTDPTWDATTATTLHVCVMARGGTGLAVDTLRIGVQE